MYRILKILVSRFCSPFDKANPALSLFQVYELSLVSPLLAVASYLKEQYLRILMKNFENELESSTKCEEISVLTFLSRMSMYCAGKISAVVSPGLSCFVIPLWNSGSNSWYMYACAAFAKSHNFFSPLKTQKTFKKCKESNFSYKTGQFWIQVSPTCRSKNSLISLTHCKAKLVETRRKTK